MSATDLTARALAVAAASDQPALFSDFSSRSVTNSVDRVETSGYSEPGEGAGTYISDALCSSALLSAHPRFVFRTSNLRIFRLCPENGAISVEQGGALGTTGTNDQPAIQAAIDYAQAVGIGEVEFTKPSYELWCPPRTHPADAKFEIDGHPLVVQRSLRLSGAAPSRTLLDFKGLNGANPETSWQVVAKSSSDSSNAVWRGGGLLVLGDQSDPGSNFAIGRLELNRLIFRGNRLRTGNHSYPASTSTGDGWDLTDKAFWMQDTRVGDLSLIDTDFIGWKGEIFYLGGYAPLSVTLERCKLLTTNATALNFGVPVSRRIIHCEIGDAYQAEESVGALQVLYSYCLWRDSTQAGIGGGPSFGLPAGYPYSYPTRDNSTQPPLVKIEGGEFRNITTVYFGSWVHAQTKFVDSVLSLTSANTYGLQDVYCEIDAWMDQVGSLRPVFFVGPATLTTGIPGAPAGTYVVPPSNIYLKMSARRTEVAKLAGRNWLPPYWNGYFDPSCRFEFDGVELQNEGPQCFDTPPKSFPFIAQKNVINIWSGANSAASLSQGTISANGEFIPRSPAVRITANAAATYDLTLSVKPDGAGGGGPANTYGYAQAQPLRIIKTNGTGVLRFVKGASASFAVSATRSLINQNDWIGFEWNRWNNRWEETGFFTSA